ncbi:MAG TPA: hypothetical protein VFB43_06950 [Terracidiphilus sp.]|nr:hypothetical protein [Terracidiphilus sp.]
MQRVRACLATLRRHGVAEWALTGGIAIELRLIERDGQVEFRSLNDLDFVTSSFDAVPNTLGTEFLVGHVHPFDPPDKIIAQFVSSELALRINAFRTHPEVMNRASVVQTEFGTVHTVSLNDLVGRAARLALPLADGQPVLSKHAGDFLRLLKVANLEGAEQTWPQHRRVGNPESFQKAATLLRELILRNSDLLKTPTYSQSVSNHCSRCANVKGLELANREIILSALGYC